MRLPSIIGQINTCLKTVEDALVGRRVYPAPPTQSNVTTLQEKGDFNHLLHDRGMEYQWDASTGRYFLYDTDPTPGFILHTGTAATEEEAQATVRALVEGLGA